MLTEIDDLDQLDVPGQPNVESVPAPAHPTDGVVEVCDGFDNDGDGLIDGDDDSLTTSCAVPLDLSAGQTEHEHIVQIQEWREIHPHWAVIDEDDTLYVDHLVDLDTDLGQVFQGSKDTPTNADILPPGGYRSTLLHFDVEGQLGTVSDVQFEFSDQIIRAVIWSNVDDIHGQRRLNASDAYFGRSDVTTSSWDIRGLEGSDTYRIDSADSLTVLGAHVEGNTGLDNIRVLTCMDSNRDGICDTFCNPALPELEVCDSGCAYDNVADALAVAERNQIISLTSSESYGASLVVDESVCVRGKAGERPVLDAGGGAWVVQVPAGIDLILENLDVTGADAGGGINVRGTVRLRDVSVRDNVGGFGGVWIHEEGALAVLRDGTRITSNTGISQGGGITIHRGALHSWIEPGNDTRIEIANNHGHLGGGLYSYEGEVHLRDVSFDTNHSATNGGGANVQFGAAELERVDFSSNVATGWGGGLFTVYGTINMDTIDFVSNSASNYGGAWHRQGYGSTTSDLTYSGNSTTSGQYPNEFIWLP
ncbi:hypothetical protein [Enhygromyxa salina]|uniref:hypothetical protein n=1 Tax=Enhygromyxa salina TaxID=215803 RepID=UPI0011B20558|nr:hypothetical protein [Enhygromyxa salina]